MSDDNSDARRHVESLIADLGKMVGLPEMALDQNGRCNLLFDDQPMSICYDDGTAHVVLEGAVMKIPATPSSEFYPWILEVNLAAFVNGMGCLSLDRDTDNITWLDRKPAAGLAQSDFQDWLHKSIERAELWAKELPLRANSAELAKPASTPEAWQQGSELVFRP